MLNYQVTVFKVDNLHTQTFRFEISALFKTSQCSKQSGLKETTQYINVNKLTYCNKKSRLLKKPLNGDLGHENSWHDLDCGYDELHFLVVLIIRHPDCRMFETSTMSRGSLLTNNMQDLFWGEAFADEPLDCLSSAQICGNC